MKTMTKAQHRKAVTLIKGECPSYLNGQCLPLDTPCPQCHSYSLLCKHFADSVLPIDKALYTEVTGADGLKKCVICHKPFQPASNRAKYCADCAVRERKKQEAARLRKRRAG